MPSRKRGGSISSNAVTELVNSKAVARMNANSSNLIKGGSQASNSVASLVNAGSYKAITATNHVNSGCKEGGKKKSSCCKKGGSISEMLTASLNSLRTSLGVKEAFASNSVFNTSPRSQSAPAFEYAKAGGFVPKNLNSFKDNSSYSIKNKRGGGYVVESTQNKIGLDYSDIPKTSALYGEAIDRTIPTAVVKHIANSAPNTSIPLEKSVSLEMGSIADQPIKFVYAPTGGKSCKQQCKSSCKTASCKKKSARSKTKKNCKC